MTRGKKTMAAAVQTNAVQAKAVEVKKAPEAPVKAAETVSKAAETVSKAAETVLKAAAPAKAAETVSKTAEVEKSVVVEFGGKQVVVKDVLAQAEKAYAEAKPGTAVKSISLYISPEQNAAYYVVNGEGSDDYRIDL